MSYAVANHYVANQTCRPSLSIGGVDYSNQLGVWSVSDDSAMKNGLVSTTGTITLQSLGITTGLQVEDYLKNRFKRGAEVVLDITYWNTATNTQITKRHPRGLLYVLGTSYDMASEQLSLSVGCKIALWSLSEEDNYDLFKPYAQLILDSNQKTVQNVGATLAATGQFLWQRNDGELQVSKYFGSDVYGVVENRKWVSVNGITAINASPLKSSDALADDIELSYNVLSTGPGNGSITGPVVTESNYWLEYPAITYERIRIQDTDGGGNVITNPTPFPPTINIDTGGLTNNPNPGNPSNPSVEDGCGNTPLNPGSLNDPSPAGTGGTSIFPTGPTPTGFYFPYTIYPTTTVTTSTSPGGCSYSYVSVGTAKILSASNKEISLNEYNGPGGQISLRRSERYGPAVELNNQYYADEHAYCQNRFASKCSPNGNCSFTGMTQVLQTVDETVYNYDVSDGSLVSEETSTYETTLSAAIPGDWRSGITNGIADSFSYLSTSGMYRSAYRIVEYQQDGNLNITKETLYTSSASQGGGLTGAAGVSPQNVWQPYGTEVGVV